MKKKNAEQQEENYTNQRLGEEILYYRREQNLSLKELSRLCAINIEILDELELTGYDLKLSELERIATTLGKKVSIKLTD